MLVISRKLRTEVFDVKKLKWVFNHVQSFLNFCEFCLQATGFFDEFCHLLLVLGVRFVAHLDQALAIRRKRCIFPGDLRLDGLNIIVYLACERSATILDFQPRRDLSLSLADHDISDSKFAIYVGLDCISLCK